MIDYVIEYRRLNAENKEQRARIAELESMDREECCEAFKAKQAARIAELESLQAWHPASEPPEALQNQERSRDVLARLHVTNHRKAAVVYFDHCYDAWFLSTSRVCVAVSDWRELPPMPKRDGE